MARAIKDKKERYVIFYGFTGRLAKKYSVIENMTYDKLNSSVNLLNMSGTMKDVVITLYSENDFFKKNIGAPGDVLGVEPALKANGLENISFKDATLLIRTTMAEKKEEIPFEEAEEDEMDENCVAGCTPGEHKCGK